MPAKNKYSTPSPTKRSSAASAASDSKTTPQRGSGAAVESPVLAAGHVAVSIAHLSTTLASSGDAKGVANGTGGGGVGGGDTACILSAALMRAAGFHAGQIVRIGTPPPTASTQAGTGSAPASTAAIAAPTFAFARLWPHDKLAESQCRLRVFGAFAASIKEGDRVHIQSLKQPVLIATAVQLTRIDPPMPAGSSGAGYSTAIVTFIARALSGSYVVPGLQCCVNVSNQKSIFEVVSAQPNAGAAAAAAGAAWDGGCIYQLTDSTALTIVAPRTAAAATNSSPSTTGATPAPAEGESSISYASIGGLQTELELVREMVELPLLAPETFTAFGVRPPKGVLLFGPPGTGKTMIVRAIAQAAFARMLIVNGPEMMSRFVGESESKLRAVFEEARSGGPLASDGRASPAIIFIDEIDALCPKRDQITDEAQKRVVSTLLTLMDGIGSGGDSKSAPDRIVVIGATNRVSSLDPALRRPGRFDREIEIGIPNETARLDILTRILRAMPHELTREQIIAVAGVTHGFVGADLRALCKEAAMNSLIRVRAKLDTAAAATAANAAAAAAVASKSDVKSAAPASASDLKSAPASATSTPATDTKSASPASPFDAALAALRVTHADVTAALRTVRPSAMREVWVEVPHVRWSDVGGQWDIKQRLQEAVEWPLAHPEAFTRLGIEPPKGILLYGPPGCSKTLLAKALATESKRNFLAVKGPELFSKWVGESEKAVKEVFRKARAAAPAIVFFDEIDSIAVARATGGGGGGDGDRVSERVLSQLLTELDGIEPLKQVTVIAATNRPDIIDRALLRPGRIDRILYVGPPDRASAAEIFRLELRSIAHNPETVTPEALATLCIGAAGGGDTKSKPADATSAVAAVESTPDSTWSGAEIASLCRDAAMLAIEADPNAARLEWPHFLAARAKRTKPRITTEMLQFYADYQKQSGLSSI